MATPSEEEKGGASEALRSAIERTFAATVDQAVETRDRAGELLDDMAKRGQEARDEVTRRGQEARDEVARRGHEAREEVARRGQEAREAPKALMDRVTGAIRGFRNPDVTEMQDELDGLRRRVAELERELRKTKPKPKG